MIEGVKVKKLRVIPDERGRLMEILRSDDELFEKFGQVYMTTALPGIVKAWHYHKNQTDHLVCIYGKARVALYDSRQDSPTFKEVNEFIMEPSNPFLLKIPSLVYHGFKGISEVEAMVINIPTEVYNYDEPDEFRVDLYDNDIPYDWRK
ncbi:dTDP-4-dehydrorhamnose 3,5-epimerase family protein [bacterium]|nr:dTDP-4-dehydrorhamnose 3,5-epimerase family protein [bacterium]MCK4325812.1 dTDP-4-dehydrorhamnose 3,5-epimerase family protein [bacterium]MCK4437410.1 dTDP-4-dehydrorhamnose 3,5-epimerase family protein [bacterium]